ncbi:helix-turn-helix transcriptional regulator [Actinoallomurus purpureus]|uniref:helix-turn-helix domain-containing protein n=1 Tax=Actinoallomurus purpureus TaxID=478114 RepID=UPI002091E905|nr:helix-turn-helix transcriptional regulator [Actinoallomurus purpureus]MCO6010214.1 helix-turn-helix transcriptional regulator [Actinoallomurus purpureus]
MAGVRREWAARIRTARKARGWDKPEMARRLAQAAGESRSGLPDHETLLGYVKRWERAAVGISERYRMLYARALSTDEDELFGAQPFAAPVDEPAIIGASEPLAGSASGRIGVQDVDEFHRAIQQLYSIDDQYGGGRLRDPALRLLRGVQHLLDEGTYTERIGTTLRSAAGHVSELAGWAFFDSGDQERARRHYLEALFAAHVAQDHRLATLTLSSMSTQAYYQRRPQEALNLISAAEASARGWATPRVRAMLALREAVSYAAMRDRSGFSNAIARARWEHADEIETADPHWVQWLTESELTVQESSCFMDLGEARDLDRAEMLLSEALEDVIGPYQRNRTLYVTWLAAIRYRRGDVNGAAKTGIQALGLHSTVSSARGVAHLQALRDHLGAHSGNTVVREFLEGCRERSAGSNG